MVTYGASGGVHDRENQVHDKDKRKECTSRVYAHPLLICENEVIEDRLDVAKPLPSVALEGEYLRPRVPLQTQRARHHLANDGSAPPVIKPYRNERWSRRGGSSNKVKTRRQQSQLQVT